jgi:glycosyltransferase involved in cell wall biosynthesis
MAKSSHIYRSPKLRVQFVVTSLPIGGAEILLRDLVQRLDRTAFVPEVVCLKEPGELGDEMSQIAPTHARLLRGKWDIGVVVRLMRLFREQRTDVVITIGAGDKMFWGRLAGKLAGVPVICSALHSTGWPDGIGRLNRCLTPLTDAFIACAQNHAEYLRNQERLPSAKIAMIPNGVDTDRFRPNHTCRQRLRSELGIPRECPVVGIVAALRPEKNHSQFLAAASIVLQRYPQAHFVIVGDGPERPLIEQTAKELQLTERVHLLGRRGDTALLLAGMNIFCLTSRNEANPVSILEALACGVPVVSPDVGSVRETVQHGQTGLLTEAMNAASTAEAILDLLGSSARSQALGLAGRQLVRNSWSIEGMVRGYEQLMESLYNAKAHARGTPIWRRPLVDLQPIGVVSSTTWQPAMQKVTQEIDESTAKLDFVPLIGLADGLPAQELSAVVSS